MIGLYSFLVLSVLAAGCLSEVIVHLFEWRFDDIAHECAEFLPKHGYSAVQVSPVNEYAVLPGRPWWERYQPFSYKIASRSGNEDDFRKMVATCNNAKVKVYVDVVLNHMSKILPPRTIGTAGSHPDTAAMKYFDVPYGRADFHRPCRITNWNDKRQVRHCQLAGLQDLDQSRHSVRQKMIGFLNRLVDIGVSGFRVDAAKHMAVEDLAFIYKGIKNLNKRWFPPGSRPYIYQQVAWGGDHAAIKPQDYTHLGSAVDFKYSLEISRAFRRQNPLRWFRTFGESWGLLPWAKSVVFVDNHDTQRTRDVLTYKESRPYKMAVGFMLAWPHNVARVMSSYRFNKFDAGPPNDNGVISRAIKNNTKMCERGWVCEHRWRQVYNMVLFSKVVEGTEVTNWWDNGNNQVAFCRGNKGFIVFNNQHNDLNADLQTCLSPGVYCDVVSGSRHRNRCTGLSVNVRGDGRASILVRSSAKDGFLAIHINSKIQ